jgi:hypothetical protein
MGGCYSNNSVTNQDDDNETALNVSDIELIRNSWKIVSNDDGLVKYGTNMMIK